MNYKPKYPGDTIEDEIRRARNHLAMGGKKGALICLEILDELTGARIRREDPQESPPH